MRSLSLLFNLSFLTLLLLDETSSLSQIFFVLRHGETDANVAGVIQGSSDFSRLTEKGQQQARKVGTVVGALGTIESVYVSPLARAQETFTLIREQNKNLPEATVWHDLRELDMHEWEGKDRITLQISDPAAWKAWEEGNAFDLEVSGHKPLVDVWDRATIVWERLRKNSNPGTSTILVCHGTLGQALLNTALGRDASFFRDIRVPNCGLVEIDWPTDSPAATSWRWHHPEASSRWTLSEWEAFTKKH
eukprot:CAMPEP_0194250174 /NCGR_PEP_ID=MMETSP0158-20130606/22334_1 /TAXON_ID=33649 /ORGANISM="Thalassionema nitzschioides, Strain L26-B" /LENGTH=247 /DNA_ID=CAMNT_0038986881 /DNA_START=10 /DNA_END=753 /DNA_ORIENTATION=-